MKKAILITTFLAVLLGLFAIEVTIGAGTTYNTNTGYPAPYGGYYKNSKMQYLITVTEFHDAGGGAGDITSLAFNNYAVNGCGARPLIISMGHTDLTALTTTFVTGLTTVFSTMSYQPVVGWQTHTFSTPFTWNGTQNVVVEVFFGDTAQAYTYNAGTYYTSTSSVYKTISYYSDTANAATQATGSLSYNRANMRFSMPVYNPPLPPNPATIVSPANGATDVSRIPTLYWATGGGTPTGYKLYFGSTRTPAYIGDLGNVTSWTSPTPLSGNTPYYWKVVPYNMNGDNTSGDIWSFTTTEENQVIIGDGVLNAYLPIYPYYGYTYSQSIFLQSEIQIPGKRIEKVRYYWNGVSEATVSNDWVIYLGHTSQSVLTDWIPLGSLQQCFAGEVPLPGTAGWIEITLTTPFIYNNTDNLVICVDENEASYDSNICYFYCTGSAGARSIRYYNDTTNPDPAAPPIGTLVQGYPNVKLEFGDIPVGMPAAPLLSYPANGATLLPLSGWQFSWNMNNAGGLPDYYVVYMKQGDDYDITNEYNYMFDDLHVTSFDPTANGVTFNNSETWYWTVQAVNGLGDAIVDPPWRFDITPPPPYITTNPTSLTETLTQPDDVTSSQILTINNTGGLPLNYSIGFEETTVRAGQITPYNPALALQTDPNAGQYSEHSTLIGPLLEAQTRAIFDIQFAYPTFLNDGEYGIGTDGSYFYTSDWSSNAGGVDIAKYALDGTYIEEFSVPGATNCRDLAFDGTYFYGAANSTTIYQMDFTAHTLIGTITAPVAVRGIAYDSDQDAFWVGNGWNADLRLINRSGTQLAALTPAIASFAGLAYDNISGTPTLWGNTQNGAYVNTLAQIDITTGAVLQSLEFTDTMFPGISTDYSAGGLEIATGLVPGTATLLGLMQNWKIWGMELCTVASWVSTDPRQGTVAAGGHVDITVNFDATALPPSATPYTGNLLISHNTAQTSPMEIPVSLTVNGVWPAVFNIDPTTLNYGDVEQLNSVENTFTITNSGGALINIGVGDIYIGGDVEGNFILNTPGLPVTLNYNQDYSFMVTFTPQTQGAKTATLYVEDNLTRTLNSVPLSGNGIPEQIDYVVNVNGTLVGTDTVDLTWAIYNGVPGVPGWLHYDDGTNVDGIGNGGAATFDVAAKFDSGTMYAYSGMEITKINYFPRSANTAYTLKVWTGVDGSLAPTTLVYSQVHVPTVLQWNEVLLTTPVPIAGNQAVWVGYENVVSVIDAGTDDYYPAGCDAGPAIVGYGDLISLGTWESMFTSYNLNYNWNIQAYLDNPPVRGQAPQLLSIPVINNANRDRNLRFASASGSNSSRVLRGFNVFRDTVQQNVALVQTTTYTDLAVPIGPHSYTVQAVYYSANSLMSDPFFIDILPPVPMPLPFVENWTAGDFVTNQWETSASNWLITTTTGLDVPSAEFSWSPQITNYAEYLTSYYLDGAGHTGLKLKFDLSLNNYSTAAENLFSPEIWNSTTSTWTTLDTFSSFENSGLGWSFDTYVYDISAYAAGQTFRVRFKAHGEDSYEINYWYLDNIVIEDIPATLAQPVVNLTQSGSNVTIAWDPVPGTDWYLFYTSDDPYGPFTFSAYYPVSYANVYGCSYTQAGVAKKFFQIGACSMAMPTTRRNMLTNGPTLSTHSKK
jgi:hypothetical protein